MSADLLTRAPASGFLVEQISWQLDGKGELQQRRQESHHHHMLPQCNKSLWGAPATQVRLQTPLWATSFCMSLMVEVSRCANNGTTEKYIFSFFIAVFLKG